MNNMEMAKKLRQLQTLIGEIANELEEPGTANVVAKNAMDVVMTSESSDLELRVSNILREIGIPAHIKGYTYIRTAIIMTVNNPQIMENVTKVLYPEVAKAYNTTSSRVERAIRHAIEVAWDRGNYRVLEEYFGATIDDRRGKPTNSEFVAMLADKIRLENKN